MRGKQSSQRKVSPDQRFKSTTVTRLINYVMLDGKKTAARNFVYGALDTVAEKVKKEPMEVLERALENVKPSLEVRSRRVGGANYQIPMPVPEERQEALALRWIVQVTRRGKGKGFEARLVNEFLSAYNGEGAAVKKKEETEHMAEANKAFAHFRW